uniref:Uncharacterized protein n=1 Tax=Fagus sylvatica TaxID=28930 RepID=A0A2N9EXH5_FAGSY
MAEEASKLRGLEARVAALETKFNFLLQFIRRWTEREEEKKKATISKRQKEIYPALSLSKAAQTLPTPRRPAFHIPRPSRTEPRQFQPLPIPVLQLYTLLIKKKMITPVNQRTRIGPQPKDYNKDLTCEYHQGEVGHTVENCRVLRHQKDEEVDITSTKIPWEPLFHELKKRGLLPAPRAPKESTEAGTCQYHPGARDHNLQGCEEFKKEVAERKKSWGKLTPATPLEMSGPDPVVIRYATKEKVMLQTASVRGFPWNYGMKVISTRESKPKTKEEVVGNLTSGLGGITRSGRCYTPEELEKRRRKEAGKAVEDPTKTKAAEEEAADFLRIIKSSEYSIVKQLSKMPSHISVLSLLLASESHRKALLKVLNEAYVPEGYHWAVFREHEVLIDNGSALNVCPLSTLEKLDIDPTRVRVNSMVVRAFDGTRREVLGEIDLPVEIGPQVYDINFQVLRIDSPYNLLLGRPWLHTAGAVPSSLHQKMKLIIGNQLVTILAEEPISIYNDGEIPYIDGCAPEEASFHSFEFVTVIHRVAAVEPRLSKAGIMVAKEFVKAGFQPGQGMDWGIPRPEGIVRWPMKPGGKELQRSSKERNGLRGRWSIPHIRTTFPASAMFQVDEGDVDELALLFTEDLNVNAITTEGDSAAFPVHADQHEEIDLEDFLDEENLKGVRGHLVLSAEESCLLGRFGEELSWTDTNATARQHTTSQRARSTIAEEGEEPLKAPPPSNIITTTVAEEEYAGPMVEGLSIHTIAGEEDSTTTPPTRHCQQGEEVKTWTCVPLLQRVSSSNEITRKTSNDPHVSKIDNKTDCSLDNIDNSDEEIELPKPREVKIGTRCAAEQKEALIALLREFHENLRLVLPRHARPRHRDIVVHKIPLKPECKPVKASTAPNEARSHFEDQGRGGKAIEGRFPKHSNLFGLGSQYSPGAEKGRKSQNQRTSYSHSWTDSQGTIRSRWPKEDKSKTAFVTHWGTFVYDVMPFGLKNAGATYQRAMVTLFHDMIHHEIEVYVDDMIAKSRTAQDHLTDLRKLVPATEEVSAQIEPEQVLPEKPFDKIKEYLLNPPILVPPTPGRPLILYLTVQEASMGCMLGQQDETGKKEQAIYYLSKKFTEPETRYLLVEKTCCALGLGLQEAETVHALLHHLVGIPDGPDQAIKGQAIADYLADYPSEQLELNGLRVPRRRLSQTNGEWQARDPKLIPYQRYISRLVPKFKYVTFTYTPRAHNHFADALATLASLIKLVEGDDVRPLRIETRDIPGILYAEEGQSIDSKRCTRDLMGAHANGPFLARKIMRAGYYWLTMERDCIRHVQTCHKCQMYQNSKNAPPQYLHTMASPWPFSAWGMDEACSFKNVTQVAVTRFVKNNIICRYGMPEMLITDNASNLKQPHDGPVMPAVQDSSTTTLLHTHLPYALCAYRTSVRTSVGATPYSLVYGMEAVLPVEVEIPSLRILSQTQLEEAEWAQARYEQLNFIDEKRLAALCHGQLYQRRIERAYNKKARPRTFQPGDLVLKKRNMALSDPRGKFAPSYEGPYVVKKAFSGGAIILADMDGEEFRSPINSDSVIKRPGKRTKIRKDVALGWKLPRVSLQNLPKGSGKGRIPLIMLLPDGSSSRHPKNPSPG